MGVRLRDHLELISNPVYMEILDGEKVLYEGYKGSLEYQMDKDTYIDREVKHFAVRVEAIWKRASQGSESIVITELNCGDFYYRDLYEKWIYSYELASA